VARVDTLASEYGWTRSQIMEEEARFVDALLELIRIKGAKAEADRRLAQWKLQRGLK
jgi:hypothetical protein